MELCTLIAVPPNLNQSEAFEGTEEKFSLYKSVVKNTSRACTHSHTHTHTLTVRYSFFSFSFCPTLLSPSGPYLSRGPADIPLFWPSSLLSQLHASPTQEIIKVPSAQHHLSFPTAALPNSVFRASLSVFGSRWSSAASQEGDLFHPKNTLD